MCPRTYSLPANPSRPGGRQVLSRPAWRASSGRVTSETTPLAVGGRFGMNNGTLTGRRGENERQRWPLGRIPGGKG